VELDAVTEPELERIAKLGSADLVVGILDSEHAENSNGKESCAAIPMVREALAELPNVARAVVVCNHDARGPAANTPEVVGDGPSPEIISCTLAAPRPGETAQQNVFNAYRSVLAAGEKLGVRASAVIVSRSQAVTRQWIYRLVHPVLELGFDLVAPRYTRHKTEGLLNRSILSPLHRALYGEQLQNPMGPDFGLSGKLLRKISGQAMRRNPLAALAATAGAGGLQICESNLGARTQRATDWMNLSSLLAEILGPVFLEMEKQASVWQSIRGSKTLPGFGTPEAPSGDAQPIDVRRMIESFHLGTQNLLDVWGLVLPPTTLLELRKLSRVPAEQFRMPDDLWVRIVYDFALGHRLQTINRDHLLRSLTPLYLGWIASYALQIETAGPVEIDSWIERLSRAYETNKPYLVSRWRWPDRFNP
jgi:hypothetical protein